VGKRRKEILNFQKKEEKEITEKSKSRIAEEKKFAVDRTAKVDENKKWTIL